ncbi:MAG: helix-turn-helix domain-containing protein [Chloroflexi bacterium]|nr:helix-turn-helix domain-containing protein [Chloroflexota bacterium]
MQATRREILDILKRRAGGTVDELAKALDLSPMCIRQHLALLERDGLVSPREVRRRTGRPHYLYTLTEKSDDYFPKGYDRLASLLLGEIKQLQGPAAVRDLLRSLGGRLGDEYARGLEGKSFEDRLTAAVAILSEGSGLGEWQRDGDSYILREFDCPFRKVASQHPEVCNLHAQVLGRALNAEVEHQESMAGGDVRCTYRLRPQVTA